MTDDSLKTASPLNGNDSQKISILFFNEVCHNLDSGHVVMVDFKISVI